MERTLCEDRESCRSVPDDELGCDMAISQSVSHMYADDTQLHIPIGNHNSNVYRLEKCITDTKNWMTTRL